MYSARARARACMWRERAEVPQHRRLFAHPVLLAGTREVSHSRITMLMYACTCAYRRDHPSWREAVADYAQANLPTHVIGAAVRACAHVYTHVHAHACTHVPHACRTHVYTHVDTCVHWPPYQLISSVQLCFTRLHLYLQQVMYACLCRACRSCSATCRVPNIWKSRAWHMHAHMSVACPRVCMRAHTCRHAHASARARTHTQALTGGRGVFRH